MCKGRGKDDWYREVSQCEGPGAGSRVVHLEGNVAGVERAGEEGRR